MNALAYLGAALCLVCANATAQTLTVFAAASLKNALDAIVAERKPAGARVSIAYGASSTLARQIENGAPAEVYVSADLEWMDYLAARGLIRADTRRNLIGNALVLIAPQDGRQSDGRQTVDLRPGVPLAALLGGGRLAIADPHSVPAGKYAHAALEKLGVWPSVAGRLAPAENVRAALMLVARGEAPLGIVYASDAAAEPKVRIAARFDARLHPPIVYPAALTAAARGGDAAQFLDALGTPAARALFERHGFARLN